MDRITGTILASAAIPASNEIAVIIKPDAAAPVTVRVPSGSDVAALPVGARVTGLSVMVVPGIGYQSSGVIAA